MAQKSEGKICVKKQTFDQKVHLGKAFHQRHNAFRRLNHLPISPGAPCSDTNKGSPDLSGPIDAGINWPYNS